MRLASAICGHPAKTASTRRQNVVAPRRSARRAVRFLRERDGSSGLRSHDRMLRSGWVSAENRAGHAAMAHGRSLNRCRTWRLHRAGMCFKPGHAQRRLQAIAFDPQNIRRHWPPSRFPFPCGSSISHDHSAAVFGRKLNTHARAAFTNCRQQAESRPAKGQNRRFRSEVEPAMKWGRA